VGGDSQEETPIVASVGKLLLRRAAERDPAEHKRPRVVSEFLLASIPLVTDQLNSLQVFQCALRDADRRQRRLKRSERRTLDGGASRNSTFDARAWNVIKP